MSLTFWKGCAAFLLAGMFPFHQIAAQPPAVPSSASSAPTPLWANADQSSGKRPIEVARFGQGSRYVLIVGSIAGNDPDSLTLIDATCRLSQQFAPPEPISLLFIRTPNPDGLAEHVHTNSRGVDLNRNFPSRNFTLSPNRLTGPQPASELETQYLLRVLDEFKPARVLHIQSGLREQPLVLLNDIWVKTSGEAVLPPDVPQSRYHYTLKAGSLEEFVDAELKLPVATVSLAKGARQIQPAEILRLAVGQLIQPAKPDEPLAGASVSAGNSGNPPESAVASKSTFPSTSPIPPEEKKPLRGEVQLLPTPPVFAPTSTPRRSPRPDDHRFQTLPSPRK
ncbi:MAG TPA: hypothetical protein VNQ76_09555 [Planctomicrobium sp.]|nr:hypothetical protein [Planctomicrobium sp.]